MKNLYHFITTMVILCFLFSLGVAGELDKSFTGIRVINMESTSSDCFIKAGATNDVHVHMVSDVFPEDAFKPEIRQSGDRLYIDEKWRGSSSGKVVWTLTVPKGIEIDYSSASGDLDVDISEATLEAKTASGDVSIQNIRGDLEVKTASGDVLLENVNGKDIEVKTASGEITLKSVRGDIQVSTASGDVEGDDVQGDLEMSTASGEIKLDKVKGAMEFSCASGDITLYGIILEEAASFSTASGDVRIVLAETPAQDIEMSAASGDVTLDYNGNPLQGYFELSARKRGGNIDAPYDFDTEEEYEQYGQTYERKSFTREGDTPRIYISTSSGRAVLKK